MTKTTLLEVSGAVGAGLRTVNDYRRFTKLKSQLRLVAIALVSLSMLTVSMIAVTPNRAYAAGVKADTSYASHIVASGPGFVIVGEGARIATTHPLSISTSSPGSQQVGGKPVPFSVTNCGWVTCSVYLSVMQTQWFYNNLIFAGGIYAGIGGFCDLTSQIPGLTGAFAAWGCGAVWAIYGGYLFQTLSNAAQDWNCLRVRFGLTGLEFYNDYSIYCQWS
jgi:hypothetical protein